MNKRLVLILIVAFTVTFLHAQRRTSSPYSYFGIGSLKFKGSVESQSMGGLSVYTDSIHINFRNPASYAGDNLESFGFEGRPVKFTVGGSHTQTNFSTDASEDKGSATSFDYLGLAFPVAKKLGIGLGLIPYTAVGYQIESTDANGNLASRFFGEGGLNKAYLSFGYQILPNLSVGATLNYNFGNIESRNTLILYDQNGAILQYSTREDSRSDLSGINLDFGAVYKTKFTDKLEFTGTATFSPKSDISSQNSRTLNAISLNTLGQEFVINTLEEGTNLQALGLDKTDLTLPSSISFGAGIGEPLKWFAGIEYEFENTDAFANPFFTSASTNYENASRISVGGFYIPEYDSFSSYLKRVVYRAGFRYQDTGLVLRNESIKEFGISFGVGLPVGNVFSNANLGFEYGQQGTTSNGLVRENFFKFQFSLSLNDRWFQKAKIN